MPLGATKLHSEEEKAFASTLSELKRAQHPNSKVSVEDLVLIETKVNDLAEAIIAKAGELNEYKDCFIEIYHRLNKLFIEKNDKEKAEKNLVRAFKVDKSNIETIFRLGQFYHEKENIEKSKKFFERVNELADLTLKAKKIDKYLKEKKYIETVYNLGIYHFEEDRFLKAGAIFDKVIRLASIILNTPGTPLDESIRATRLESDSWFYLGKIKQQQKKNIETIKLFERAIEIDGNEKAYLALGETFYKLGKLDEALKNFENAVRNDPDNIKAYEGIFNVFEDEDRPLESFLEMIEKADVHENHMTCFLKGEAYLRFAKKNNLARFKDVKQTTVLYEVFEKIIKPLNKAESSFSESFSKKDSQIGKEIEDQIKEKVRETRGLQKMLKNYRKGKVAAYGANLDEDSLNSFELYFKWSKEMPLFSATTPYEEFARLHEKSSMPHYFLGRAYLRETVQLSKSDESKKDNSADIFAVTDLALKSLNRAKKFEVEKGILHKPIQDALSELHKFQRKKK